MNERQVEIDESELHAWVDGRLPADRRATVAAAIAADPELARKAEAYRRQNEEIRALFGGIAAEPAPARLDPRRIAARRSRPRWLAPLAASIAWLAVGATGGWFANDWLGHGPLTDASRQVAEMAMSAHRVYAVEVVHPVEVFADQEAHLVKWLSRRLGHELRTPNLAPLGFRLVGGRLLPASGGEPAAQFLYENDKGRRVTVYISDFPSGQETAFRYEQADGGAAFVWLEPELGFAIAGDLPREPLLAISKIVYGTFEPTR